MTAHPHDNGPENGERIVGAHGQLADLVERLLPPSLDNIRTAEFEVELTNSEIVSLLTDMQVVDLMVMPGELLGCPVYDSWDSADPEDDDFKRRMGNMGLSYARSLQIPLRRPDQMHIMAMSEHIAPNIPYKRMLMVSLYYRIGRWSAQQAIGLCGQADTTTEAVRIGRIEFEDEFVAFCNARRASTPAQTLAFVSRARDMLTFGVPTYDSKRTDHQY